MDRGRPAPDYLSRTYPLNEALGVFQSIQTSPESLLEPTPRVLASEINVGSLIVRLLTQTYQLGLALYDRCGYRPPAAVSGMANQRFNLCISGWLGLRRANGLSPDVHNPFAADDPRHSVCPGGRNYFSRFVNACFCHLHGGYSSGRLPDI